MNLMTIWKNQTPIRKLLKVHMIAGGVPILDYTVTGNPVKFLTNVAKPLSVIASFTPVQSGSGDPSPDNVRPITGFSGATVWRTGKNLLDSTYRDDSLANTIYIYRNHGLVLCPGKYTFSYTQQCSLYVMNNTTDAQMYVKYNATSLTFTLTETTSVYFTCYKSGGIDHTGTIQLELGETETDHSTYTGESVSVAFPAFGKNLLNPALFSGNDALYTVAGDTITVKRNDERGWADVNGMDLPAGSYVISRTNVQGNMSIRTSLDNYSSNIVLSGSAYARFTLSDNCTIKVKLTSASSYPYDTKMMIEQGSSPTAYEPFTNTAYGGTIELNTGIMTVEWAKTSARWGDIVHAAGYGMKEGYLDINYPITIAGDSGGFSSANFCNVAAPIWASLDNTTPHYYTAYSNPDQTYRGIVILPSDTDNDLEVCIVSKLKEPYEIQLDPVTVQALIGNNVLWSDLNGDLTVTYKKKG